MWLRGRHHEIRIAFFTDRCGQKKTSAVALYEKLGFRRYGTFPRNTKYADGSYDSAYWMMKEL